MLGILMLETSQASQFLPIQFPEVSMEKQIKWIWIAIIVLSVAVAFLGGRYRKACITGRMMEKYHMGQNMKDGMMGRGMREGMGGNMKGECCKTEAGTSAEGQTAPAAESTR
jgi:hypothetical protein